MSKVNIVIATKATEIGNDSFPGLNSIVVERPTFPFGEGEGNFEVNSGEVARFESGWTFGALVEERKESRWVCDIVM